MPRSSFVNASKAESVFKIPIADGSCRVFMQLISSWFARDNSEDDHPNLQCACAAFDTVARGQEVKEARTYTFLFRFIAPKAKSTNCVGVHVKPLKCD